MQNKTKERNEYRETKKTVAANTGKERNTTANKEIR